MRGVRATWTVFCYVCANWIGEDPSREKAIQTARDAGWKRTKYDGWMCPECAKAILGKKRGATNGK